MKENGIRNVATLLGGLNAWRNEGFTVETGAAGPQP